MPAQAVRVDNSDTFAGSIAATDRGVEVAEAYLVTGAMTDVEALLAPGLPRRGDARPGTGLVCSSVSLEPMPGRGNYRALAVFAPEEPSSGTTEPKPPLSDADSYTVLERGTSQITAYWGWNALGNPDFSSPPDFGPVNNGNGWPRDTGTLLARVVRYFTNPAQFDLLRLTSLMRDSAINDAAITLPRVAKAFNITLAQGQARYVGFDGPELVNVPPAAPQNVYKVVHTLELAEDFIVRWLNTDQNGEPTTGSLAYVNPKRSFAGLW